MPTLIKVKVVIKTIRKWVKGKINLKIIMKTINF
jgi:hypothetical protein